ncbi:Acetyltransferase, GNAT family [hydrothermal vent metagenome]|uniref:Acetyltransferase, GNAT family n=1 Tax=hydrothermal vent metagenome TaxID=652676 RepID=A0A3B0VR50_9ZZZZ
MQTNTVAAIKAASTEANYTTIATLATTIWQQHYTPIIGEAQVQYMLDKYQSVTAIKQQSANGVKYFIIIYQDMAVGYLAYIKQNSSLFLSKLYILKPARNKGFGKQAIAFIQSSAIAMGLNKISLTVNKYNAATIRAYEKMGFDNIGEIITDVGNGFVMDDYKLEKTLN